MLVMTWRKRDPPPVSVGLHFGTVTTETVFSFLKKLQIELEYDAVIPFLGIYQKETKNTNSKRYNHSRKDHILGHKSSLCKCKKIEIFPVIFSDHSAVRLDLN